MPNLLSDEQLADHLGITVEDVHKACAKDWPHLRPKRSVWRFTPEQVAEIERLITVRRRPIRGRAG